MGKLTVKKFKTKRRVKNIDQIFEDLSSQRSINKFKNQPMQEDLPGMAQHYCIECAKYYQDEAALQSHRKTKVHKRRLRLIKEGPYTQEEADAAAGNSVEKYLKNNNMRKEKLAKEIKPVIDLDRGDAHIKASKKAASADAQEEKMEVE